MGDASTHDRRLPLPVRHHRYVLARHPAPTPHELLSLDYRPVPEPRSAARAPVDHARSGRTEARRFCADATAQGIDPERLDCEDPIASGAFGLHLQTGPGDRSDRERRDTDARARIRSGHADAARIDAAAYRRADLRADRRRAVAVTIADAARPRQPARLAVRGC